MAFLLYGFCNVFWGWSLKRISCLRYHNKKVSHQYERVDVSWALSYQGISSLILLPGIQTIEIVTIRLTCLSPCVSRCFLRAGMSLNNFFHPEWWFHLYKFFSIFLNRSLSKSDIPFLSPLVEETDLLFIDWELPDTWWREPWINTKIVNDDVYEPSISSWVLLFLFMIISFCKFFLV